MPTGAVITADIVNFTRLMSSSLEKRMVATLSDVLKDHKVEFYRGDSFQAYIKDPAEALRLALQVRTAARNFSFIHDVRVSIGIGQVDTPVRTLRTASSEAFILSGRAFDQLSDERRLMIQSANEAANPAFRVIAFYADFIIRNLTSKQAEVVGELLKENTQTQVAKKLRKAQGTVNKHVQAAAWGEIERLLNEYQNVLTQFKII